MPIWNQPTGQPAGPAEAEKPAHPPGGSLLDPKATLVCSAGITPLQLREFLFNLHDELEVDPAVSEHVASGCASCDRRRKLMYATTPYLQNKLPPKFSAEEMPARPRPLSTPESLAQAASTDAPVPAGNLKQLKTEISRRLADLLATPAEPLALDKLEKLARDVFTAVDQAERVELVEKVTSICNGRYARLAPELRAEVEQAAEQLLTALTNKYSLAAQLWEPEPAIVNHDARRPPPEKDPEATERKHAALLTYLMTRAWFLNAEGKAAWGIHSPGGSVVLYFDVLSERAGSPQRSQPEGRLGLSHDYSQTR
jgi:hypothetical protein